MPDLFHNPYHFVPLGSGQPPETAPLSEFQAAPAQRKHPHLTHDRFVRGAHSGRLVCKVTVETPLICGNRQEERGEGRTKLIHPFELEDGIPALPSTALRGMLSSLAEAASHSALRVLKNTSLSHRMAIQQESLSAIGLLVERTGPGNTPVLKLQPLTLPTLRCANRILLPNEFQTMFKSSYGQPLLKAYVDGYRKKNGVGAAEIEVRPRSFLSRQPNSYSSDHQEFWYAHLAGTVSLDIGELHASAGQFDSRSGQFLLGQKLDLTVDPIPQADFERLLPAQQGAYVRGFLRVLGIHDRERDMPTTKKHEYFIPYPPGSESAIPSFDVTDAVARFHALADSRTEEDPQLPFEVQGSSRNNQNNPRKKELRLRAGDIVFFRPDRRQLHVVAEVSVSSIWRAGNGSTHQFFTANSPELLPLSPGRNLLTLAEQLFGAVEVRDKKQAKALQNKPAFALASRLRISHGLLHSPAGDAYQPHTELLTPEQTARLNGGDPLPDIPLKNLASPKLPSPALYFKPKAPSASGYVPKRDLNPANHAPHGRKFYLRRPNPAQVRGNELFVHPDRLADARDCQGITRQHQSVQKFVRRGSVFYFHLDFDNLSDLELQLLAYVLAPHSDFRHQLGHGKPLGLGQIHIEPVGLLEVDRLERYGKDALTANRHHQAWVAGSPTTEWPGDLRPHVPDNALDLVAKMELLRQDFKTWANKNGLSDVLRALELLGNPKAVNYPVHYPQSVTAASQAAIERGTAAFEKELFRWFVQNDRLNDNNQYLAALVNAQGQAATSIPALDREPETNPSRTTYGGAGGRGTISVATAQQGGMAPSTHTGGTTKQDSPHPKDLHNQIIQDCVVEQHKRVKHTLQIRFRVPCGTFNMVGLLDTSTPNPKAATQYPEKWRGPMKVLNPQKVQNIWQCTLRPVPLSSP